MFLERIDLSIEIIVLHEKILTKLLNVLSHGSSFSLINHNLNESIGSMICFAHPQLSWHLFSRNQLGNMHEDPNNEISMNTP